MDYMQSGQLTQALAFIGLISLAGKLSGDDDLTELPLKAVLPLAVGAPLILSSQSGTQGGAATGGTGSGGANLESFLLPLGLGFLLCKGLTGDKSNTFGDKTS
jgi:hypothetical protein